MKKIFPLYAEEKQINDIKDKAKKEKRSASQFLLNRALETPNLVLGNWWDNPNALRKIIKEIKKQK